MEEKHWCILEENFPEALVRKQIICLPRYVEPDLVDELKAGLSQHIPMPDRS